MVPWQGPGCGHWGLLVVAVEAQGTGVGSALVAAAEQRLAASGLLYVGIEYHFCAGDPESERLLAWYEGKLGFRGPRHRSSGFRHCRKELPPPDAEPVSTPSDGDSSGAGGGGADADADGDAGSDEHPGGKLRAVKPAGRAGALGFFAWVWRVLVWMCGSLKLIWSIASGR